MNAPRLTFPKLETNKIAEIIAKIKNLKNRRKCKRLRKPAKMTAKNYRKNAKKSRKILPPIYAKPQKSAKIAEPDASPALSQLKRTPPQIFEKVQQRRY